MEPPWENSQWERVEHQNGDRQLSSPGLRFAPRSCKCMTLVRKIMNITMSSSLCVRFLIFLIKTFKRSNAGWWPRLLPMNGAELIHSQTNPLCPFPRSPVCYPHQRGGILFGHTKLTPRNAYCNKQGSFLHSTHHWYFHKIGLRHGKFSSFASKETYYDSLPQGILQPLTQSVCIVSNSYDIPEFSSRM